MLLLYGIRSAQHKHAVALLTMACLPQGRRAKEKLKSAQQQQQQQLQKDTGLLRSDLDASKQHASEQCLRDQNSGLQHVNQQQKAQLALPINLAAHTPQVCQLRQTRSC
jgi:hypothetical protein